MYVANGVFLLLVNFHATVSLETDVNEGCFEEGVAYPGNDLETASSPEDCQKLCQETNGCEAFTFRESKKKGRNARCFLKDSKLGRKETGVTGATSGDRDCKGKHQHACPDTHPFAYDAGRQCCSTASGDGYWLTESGDWTTRSQAWQSTSCKGESVYCHIQPGSEGYDETLGTYPCENLKVVCEDDSNCADKDEGYGKCDAMNGVCTTMCTDEEFQCDSKMCIDKPMECNGENDCKGLDVWSRDDFSDEDKCEWCNEGDVCSTEGETCVKNVYWLKDPKYLWGLCKKV